MGWSLVDDDFYDHEKTEACSLAALGVWIRGLTWCGRKLSKGYIPTKKLLSLADGNEALIDELADAGFLDEAPGGWEYHDYLHWNGDRAAEKERRVSQARHAAVVRYAKNGTTAPDCERCRRNHRRCAQHRNDAGSSEHPQSTRTAPAEYTASTQQDRASADDDSGQRCALPTPRPRPTPTICQTDGGGSGSESDSEPE
jgi:hypothetical protein